MATPKATRTLISDLNPEAKERAQRARLETLRAQGRYRELVLWLIGEPEAWQLEPDGVTVSRAVRAPLTRRIAPTRDDLAAAYSESPDPLPAPIVEYIVKHHVKGLPLKTGPKASARSTGDDDRAFDVYVRALVDALDAHEANEGPATRAVITRAKKSTKRQCGIGPGTLNGILAARRLLKSPPK